LPKIYEKDMIIRFRNRNKRARPGTATEAPSDAGRSRSSPVSAFFAPSTFRTISSLLNLFFPPPRIRFRFLSRAFMMRQEETSRSPPPRGETLEQSWSRDHNYKRVQAPIPIPDVSPRGREVPAPPAVPGSRRDRGAVTGRPARYPKMYNKFPPVELSRRQLAPSLLLYTPYTEGTRAPAELARSAMPAAHSFRPL